MKHLGVVSLIAYILIKFYTLLVPWVSFMLFWSGKYYWGQRWAPDLKPGLQHHKVRLSDFICFLVAFGLKVRILPTSDWSNVNVLKLRVNVKLLLIFEVEFLNKVPKLSSSRKLFALVVSVTETNCDSQYVSLIYKQDNFAQSVSTYWYIAVDNTKRCLRNVSYLRQTCRTLRRRDRDSKVLV